MARSYCWIFFAQLVACHMQADATSATRGAANSLVQQVPALLGYVRVQLPCC